MEFDPKCVFSFRSDGESRKNEFSTQLEGLRHPGVFRCFVKPTQNGGMKPTSWNSIPRVFFFVSLRRGKSKKRVFKANGRPSSTRLFALLARAQQKCWYETDLVEFDPKGVFFFSSRWENSTKRVFNPIGRTSSSRRFPLLGKAHPKWWYETDLVEFNPKGAFSFPPDGECRKNEF